MRAGLPTTIQLRGTDFVTTEFAPIITLSPISILPITTAPVQIDTLLPITGFKPPGFFLPIVTFCHIWQQFPIDLALIIVE